MSFNIENSTIEVGSESHGQTEEAFNNILCSQTQVTIVFTMYMNVIRACNTNESKYRQGQILK